MVSFGFCKGIILTRLSVYLAPTSPFSGSRNYQWSIASELFPWAAVAYKGMHIIQPSQMHHPFKSISGSHSGNSENTLMDNGNILFCRHFPFLGHLCIYASALSKHFIFTSKKIISGLSKHSIFSHSWNTSATVHSSESLRKGLARLWNIKGSSEGRGDSKKS